MVIVPVLPLAVFETCGMIFTRLTEKEEKHMSDVLYQKTGLTVSRMAQDLMSRMVGERIPSMSEYMDRFQVSRGTAQNSLGYLKERQAVVLVSRGHLGTFIDRLDYHKLQECSLSKELLGSMPLPYSRTYQGLATALYDALAPFSANLVYARGSEDRLQLVDSGACHFTVCSRYAAQQAIQNQANVEIAVDLGPGTYLTRHVLVLRDPNAQGIESGMRVAYDRSSMDQRRITEWITRDIKGLQFVEIRAHQTVGAIQNNIIDAGVWNLDAIMDSGYPGLHVLDLDPAVPTDDFSSAVLVVRGGEVSLCQLLRRYVELDRVRKIQNDVRLGTIPAEY